jgi:nitrogen regulatory protein PII 1
MVEVLAVIRKEKSYEVNRELVKEGVDFVSWTVKGRGKEGGLRYKGFFRDKVVMPFLPKRAFSVFVDKNVAHKIVELFLEGAHTGSYGDGKVFLIEPDKEVTDMKLIKAVIRPEKVYEVIKALEKKGFKAMTMWDVVGRGKEGGVQVGETCYDELAKTLLMIAVKDEDVKKVVDTITKSAHTGAYGDGKIFVTGISEVWTIRTKERGL